MTANTGPFDNVFDFSRARVAPYRDATGQVVNAPIDTPRFDHDGLGNPKGLLIEGNPDTIQVDSCRVIYDAIAQAPATVLHDFVNAAGVRKKVAILTPNGRATINARMALRGHHLRLAYFDGYRVVKDGYVRWGNELWPVPEELLISGTDYLASGADALQGAA